MERDYVCIEELERDIALVSKSLVNISLSTISIAKPYCPKPNRRISDSFLSTLCWRSRVAYRKWKAAGCPRSGHDYESRRKSKRDVSSYLSKCRARLERNKIQKRDEMFANHHPRRFRSRTPKTEGSSLLIDNPVVTDSSSVLDSWVGHFSELGKSLCSTNPVLRDIQLVHQIEATTYQENDHILDSPFIVEEIEAALLHL